jgi:putative transposase
VTINFVQHQLWSYQGQDIRFERFIDSDLLHFTDQRTLTPFLVDRGAGGHGPPTMLWALEAYASGALIRLASLVEGAARKLAAKRELDGEEIRKKDKFAILRRFIVTALDRLGISGGSDAKLNQVITSLWVDAPDEVRALNLRPHPRSVKRWLAERGQPGERPFKQMMSQAGRVARAPRLPSLVRDKLNEAALLYWADRTLSIAESYALFSSDIGRMNEERVQNGQAAFVAPSKETHRKLIRSLEGFDTYKARFGEKLAKQRFEGCGEGLKANRFLELGCLDTKYLDNLLIVDFEGQLPLGKPYLTAVIDVFTECIVGFVVTFEPPSIYSAMECVRRANSPKLHLLRNGSRYALLSNIFGRFSELIVDNGLEYAGLSFEDGMADVGTAVRWAPVRSPTFKSPIERFFRTIDDLLLHKLPGTTLTREARKDLELNPVAEATISLEELEALLWQAINFYHFDLHTGLNAIPADLWEQQRLKYGIDVIADVRQLEKMAGAVERNRRVSRAGVQFLGLQYHDKDRTSELLNDFATVAPRRGSGSGVRTYVTKIKYNPVNLCEVHVWNDRRSRYVTLPCTEPEYAAGLSKKQHELIREFAAARNEAFSSRADRLRMRAELRLLIEQTYAGKSAQNRAKIARLVQSPRVQEVIPHGVVLAVEDQYGSPITVIENDTLGSHRNDGGRLAKRPARGGAKRSGQAKPKNAPVESPPTDIGPEFGEFSIHRFKSFGQ